MASHATHYVPAPDKPGRTASSGEYRCPFRVCLLMFDDADHRSRHREGNRHTTAPLMIAYTAATWVDVYAPRGGH